MPTRNQSGKPTHTLQNPCRKTKRSGKKYQNAIKWYQMLLKREVKEGTTSKRVEKTKEKAVARLKKYGISLASVEAKRA